MTLSGPLSRWRVALSNPVKKLTIGYRKSKSIRFPDSGFTPAKASYLFVATARSVSLLRVYSNKYRIQVFRFSTSKSASLFLQRKNPRKIAWTQVYRRMHKKGITEEVARKRSRKTVKHQRGIVGADLAAIAAKRNQSLQVRKEQRLAAIDKAKTEKKEKEAKKTKVCSILSLLNVY